MRILEIATERFRNLPDRTWVFSPGFQILQGPNEAGKSALHEAIRIGLYADAKSTADLYLRARRWGSPEGILVRLRLDLPGGPFDIVRDFAERKNALIGPGSTRSRGQQALDELLRQYLPLPTLESFLATACVRQDELAQVVRDATALRPLLEQHALSGGGVDLEELQKRLDKHLTELHRGVDKPAPKNPGRIAVLLEQQRQLTEALAGLCRKVEEQSQAAQRLATLRQTLRASQEEAVLKRTHLEHHKTLQEAKQKLAAAQQRVGTVQTRLDLAGKLTADVPGLAVAATEAAAGLAAHRTRLARAEQHRKLAQEAQGLRDELARLRADLDALATVNAEMANHEATRRAIPLSLEDLASLGALPGEIARLAQDVWGADAERDRLRGRLVQVEADITTAQDRIVALTTEQTEREAALATAQARAHAETTLRAIAESIAAREPRLTRLHALHSEVRSLTEQMQPYAYLEAVDLSSLASLISQVTTLKGALAHQGFEVRLTPQEPLTFTVQSDEEPAQVYREYAAPLAIPAGRTVALRVDGVLDLDVQNLGTVATQLTTAQERLHQVLVAMRCGTSQEAEALLAARARLAAELQRATEHVRAALGDDSLEALEGELARLRSEQAEQARLLAELPPVDRGPEVLQETLQASSVEIATLEATVRAREQERERLRESLATDPLVGTRAELVRKRDTLQALQDRLGPDPAASEAMEVQHATCARQIAEAETARARLLGGRTLEHMTARRAEVEAALMVLDAEIAPLATDALDAEGLQGARTQLSALERAAKDAETAHLRATTELGTLDVAALTTEKNDAVLQAALAQKAIAETQDFQLSPEDRIRFETRLAELDSTLPAQQQECARLEVQATAEADLQNQRADAEERLAGVERQLQYWQRRLRVDTEIRTLLDAARGRAVADLTERHLPHLMGRYLAQITGNRHADVRAGDAGLEVWSAEKGAVLDGEEFSTGTRDQFYLAMRLAHLAALFPTERPPLLLDDPLVHCDPVRRVAVLRLLADYATTGQVLLFTCHDFAEYAQYNVLPVG